MKWFFAFAQHLIQMAKTSFKAWYWSSNFSTIFTPRTETARDDRRRQLMVSGLIAGFLAICVATSPSKEERAASEAQEKKLLAQNPPRHHIRRVVGRVMLVISEIGQGPSWPAVMTPENECIADDVQVFDSSSKTYGKPTRHYRNCTMIVEVWGNPYRVPFEGNDIREFQAGKTTIEAVVSYLGPVRLEEEDGTGLETESYYSLEENAGEFSCNSIECA